MEVNGHTFERGDVFTTPDGTIQVVSTAGDSLTVTDPTTNHPQDSRAGEWDVDPKLLADDLTDGTVGRASLTVEETFEVPVYAHRDSAGFAYVSFGDDWDYDDFREGGMSIIEHIESQMFSAFGDEFWGPSPSDIGFDGDPTLPVEDEREKMYQVGTVTLTERGIVKSIDPFDEPEVIDND